jgi:homoserine O-acetyltransferase
VAALAGIRAGTLGAGIDTYGIYPVAESERLAAGIPTADPLVVIPSDHGHDGFLIEVDAVGKLVAELLSEVDTR